METLPIKYEKELKEIFSLIETTLNIKIVNWWIPLLENKQEFGLEKCVIFIKIDEDLTYERFEKLEEDINEIVKELLQKSSNFELIGLL